MRKKWLAPIVVALLLLPGVSHALTREQKALVGLKGVHVLVEDLQPKTEHRGLTPAQIKTDVELRLRKAGVRVLTKEEMVETTGMPYLYVIVNAHSLPGRDLVVYSIGVELSEFVTLFRGGEIYSITWRTDGLGTGGKEKITKLRGGVGELVDKFINNWRRTRSDEPPQNFLTPPPAHRHFS